MVLGGDVEDGVQAFSFDLMHGVDPQAGGVVACQILHRHQRCVG